jgi:hypothetical protein
MCHIDFEFEYLVASCFFLRALELFHVLHSLRLECKGLLLPIDIQLYNTSCDINGCSGSTQEWSPQDEECLMTDIHFKYHKIHWYVGIPDSHWNIIHNSAWMPYCLIRKL